MREGDKVMVGKLSANVIETPGHTLGHIAYWFHADKLAFVGDTLFSIGCGRVIEGTPGHDVALARASCATCRTTPKSIAGTNTPPPTSNSRAPSSRTMRRWPRARRRRKQQLAQGEPTIPVTIGDEKQANPFLRADVPEVAAGIGMAGKQAAQVFAEIRARKNKF